MKLFCITAALCLFTGLASATPAVDGKITQQMQFRVMLDDRQIGYHTFTVNNKGGATVIRSKAEFDVRIFFIRAYTYTHENVETWEDGCLSRIDARTDDNGKRFEVSGVRLNDAFKLDTLEKSESLTHDCIMTFAYWDPKFLNQARLLNSQTGDYVPISTKSLGERRFKTADKIIITQGFHIQSKKHDMSIKVWYEKYSGAWVALESDLEGGEMLRYLPVEGEKLLSDTEAFSSAEPG